jgi:hypothetical protein
MGPGVPVAPADPVAPVAPGGPAGPGLEQAPRQSRTSDANSRLEVFMKSLPLIQFRTAVLIVSHAADLRISITGLRISCHLAGTFESDGRSSRSHQ